MPRIEIRTSPHIKSTRSVEQIMRNVVWALLPVCAWAVWQFGISALLLIVTVTASCLATEYLFSRLSGRGNTLLDYSATITGLLLALTLPPAFPLWMGALSGFFAIALGKALFGGLGFNLFNPALVGRAFAQAAFPAAITTWSAPGLAERFTGLPPSTLALPFTTPAPIDAWSGATPLGQWKFEGESASLVDLFTGMVAGSAGETSALLILAGGLYLAWRRMLDWRIPAAVLGGAALTALPFWLLDPGHYPDPLFILFSGGLMLGAWFMASDMVASPVTPLGLWIYGLMIGFLAVIIRLFGGQPEGVMYAILLGNAMSPLIEQFTQPRIYGRVRPKPVAEEKEGKS